MARSGNNWTEQGDFGWSLSDSHMGFSVAISGNGNRLAAGAPNRDGGVVVTHTRAVNGTWSRENTFTPPHTSSPQRFGHAVALSTDGLTLAVGAPGDTSAASGIGGDSTPGSSTLSGAVHVHHRSSLGWSPQAYIKAGLNRAGDQFGSAVALSADGSRLAVGAPGDSRNVVGITPPTADASLTDSGAAYVFQRQFTTWSPHTFIKAPNPDISDLFGSAVALTQLGDTLAVGAPLEDSAATGVQGAQGSNTVWDAGAAYLY